MEYKQCWEHIIITKFLGKLLLHLELYLIILILGIRLSGNVTSVIKVPLSYAPIQKFLARIEQQSDIGSKNAITLPRMSFEMTSLNMIHQEKEQ